MSKAIFDKDTIRRYDTFGPRYTSYPTAVQFSTDYALDDYKEWVVSSNEDLIPTPLSLYLHIPFCDTICYYCGCSKVVTRDRTKAEHYIDLLKKEIDLQSALFATDRIVTQIHFGGGTPTFLSDEQLDDIIQHIKKRFSIADADELEFGIEVDPRTVDRSRLVKLRGLRINRISFGIQDFDPCVQKAVNRVQSEEQILQLMRDARELGFDSINVDLMYGLPLQSINSFGTTLETTIAADPDRIAIYNYAHLPEMFKPQRRISEQALPSAEEKLDILQLAIDRLQDAGYVYIGMDHFAKESDSLVKAQQEHKLQRNFQGYSTNADCDIVAMGITAIGRVNNNYSQNVRTIDEYEKLLAQDNIPVFRGFELEPDDRLRREIINQLLCHNRLDIARIEKRWSFDFYRYFSKELQQLRQMADDGLLEIDDSSINITDTGRLLARSVCMQFDRYLQEKNNNRFSRVI